MKYKRLFVGVKDTCNNGTIDGLILLIPNLVIKTRSVINQHKAESPRTL